MDSDLVRCVRTLERRLAELESENRRLKKKCNRLLHRLRSCRLTEKI